jgi:hypothetical protein
MVSTSVSDLDNGVHIQVAPESRSAFQIEIYRKNFCKNENVHENFRKNKNFRELYATFVSYFREKRKKFSRKTKNFRFNPSSKQLGH